MTVAPFAIANRPIGRGHPPYVVAELGINHGGDPETARRLLAEAAKAGADAAKLQVFETGRFLAASSAYFDVLRASELPREALAELMAAARESGITLFAAVFDEASADLMEDLGAPAFKIASGDLTHLPLIRHVARKGRPTILSTGGATMDEIATALEAVREAGNGTPAALLHCVSKYPTEPGEANLACMATMRARFGVPVGFSDHTLGPGAAVAAAALGAEIIEKHFTLDRSQQGPDHKLSADPGMLRRLVADVRAAYEAVGHPEKRPVEDPESIPLMRRSLAAQVSIPKGSVIRSGMVAVKRPGTGIEPARLSEVVGRRAARDIAADEILGWDSIEPAEDR